MPDVELEALAEDIKKHGQREPAILFEGMVLDGWHRFLACERVGLKLACIEYGGDDPVAYVLSGNLHRRHLTSSQKAVAIVACHNWRSSGVQNAKAAAAATMTNEQMAEAAEVSPRTIRYAKVAHQAGLGEAVREGTVSAERAAEVAKLPPRKREKALKEPKPPKERKPKVVAASKELETLYAQVKEKLVEVTEQRDDLADTARELEDKLTAFENTDPDEQQKEIMRLQKRIVRLEAEVQRITIARNDCQNKNNELIRQVKMLQRKLGGR